MREPGCHERRRAATESGRTASRRRHARPPPLTQRRRSGDRERERRAADAREPAREQAADRRDPGEREEVEPDEPAASRSGAPSWTRAFAFAVKSVKAIPTPRAARPRAARSRTGASASASTPKPAPPVANRRQLAGPERRGHERADERAEAEGGREEAEALGADVQRLPGEQRHEHVEVEADGAHDRHDGQDAGARGRA